VVLLKRRKGSAIAEEEDLKYKEELLLRRK